MVEPGQGEPPTGQGEPPTQPPAAPTSMVKEDGSFAENWPALLSDQTLHEDKTLSTFKNVENLAKSYVHVRRQVPMDKIAIPNENSSDAEWEAFHDAGGRPTTAADYNLTAPEELPAEIYPPERLTQAQDLFHKIGLNTKQANALFEFDKAVALATLKAQKNAKETAREEAKNKLFGLWGNAYGQRTHFGNVAVNEGSAGDEELKTRVCEKYGDDPDFIQLVSNLGAKFVERDAIMPDSIPTPGDIQQKINEAMAHPAYMNEKHPQHKVQVALVSKLFRDKTASTKTG